MPAIEMLGLSKRYATVKAVDELTLTVAPGQVFGFLGPNGAGKSTAIKMLTGILKPSAGAARVAGFDIASRPLEVKRRVGYLAETPYLYTKLTGREFLAFMGDLYGVPKAEHTERGTQLLGLFDLDAKADELIDGYSHGMRQKIGLAGALIHDPEVLFLDEPTQGLDPRSARTVKELLTGLARRGRTVFMSTHVLEIAQAMCDRVAIIDKGKLVATGSLEELRARTGGQGSLEDIFLDLTGGAEDAELAAYLER